MIIAYIETRLVDKSSFQGGKRDFCVDLGLIVLANCHISEGEMLPKFLEEVLFGRKMIIAYTGTRLVDKSSFQGGKRDFLR